MSQRGVEQVLGKLVTDEGFREEFFRNPLSATIGIGVTLSAREIDALLRAPRAVLTELSGQLDDRICRLHLGPTETCTEQRP